MSSKDGLPTAPHRDQQRGGVGLMVVDMINPFDFTGADRIRPKAEAIVSPILKLQREARETGAPILYVNDNFGEWHSEKSMLVERAAGSHGRRIVERLAPGDEDYFIIKPQFSAFYATNLPLLLPKLGVSRLILTGVATDICILFTAGDAHMRDYSLWVPSDAVAAELDERGQAALAIMAQHLGAQTAPTGRLGIAAWSHALDARGVR